MNNSSANWLTSFGTRSAPDDVEFIAHCLHVAHLGDHGQVTDLSGGPSELKDAHQDDQNDQISDGVGVVA